MARTHISYHSIVERVREITFQVRKFTIAMNQLKLLSKAMDDVEVRRDRAKRNQNTIFYHYQSNKRDLIASVHHVVYKVADRIAEELDCLIWKFEKDFDLDWQEWISEHPNWDSTFGGKNKECNDIEVDVVAL